MEKNGSAGILEEAIQAYVKKTKMTEAKTYIDERIAFIFGDGQFVRRLDIKYPDREEIGKVVNPHKNFSDLLNLIAAGQDVYLYGEPGTGKSTAAHQVATVLGLPFAYVSLCPQSSETLLFGFNHAGGGYVETEFYRLYKDGGIFCIDEMDNGSGALLNKLNSLLENGHGSFPCGTIPRHPKFVLVSTGNTNGNGASLQFPERRAFDPAFKERFAFLNWPLDETQEKLIAISINPTDGLAWLETVQKIRKAVIALNIERVIVSPRATFKGAALLREGKFKKNQILEMLIFKGIPENTQREIVNHVKKEDAKNADSANA